MEAYFEKFSEFKKITNFYIFYNGLDGFRNRPRPN